MKTSSMAFIAAAALCSALTVPAHGQEAADELTTAQGLANLCSADAGSRRNLCHGVLYGALITARAFNGVEIGNGDPLIARNDRIVCPPGRGVSLAEMRQDYVRWYEGEPTARGMGATNAVFQFMADSWRCENDGRTAERDARNDQFGRRIYLNNGASGQGNAEPADIFSDIFKAR